MTAHITPRVQMILLLVACILIACGCGRASDREHDPVVDQTIPEPEETSSAEPKAHMHEHLEAALRARDAIIAGNLDQARTAVGWLADHLYPEKLPPAWRDYEDKLQTAAKLVASARDLPSAAAAVGALGSACGACHTHIGGPKREPTGFELSADHDLPDRMFRHAWGVERLWEGLITPWDDAWRVGGEVLAEGRFRTAPDAVDRAADLNAELARVQTLGRDALLTREQYARGMLYGRLLARCAQCHEKVGIKP